jgi:hypothetical protein
MKKFIFILIFTLLVMSSLNSSANQEFMVNQFRFIAQWIPKCTVNTEDIFTVVWQSDPGSAFPWEGQDGHMVGVFARQFYFDGTPRCDEFQVNTTWMNWQDNPYIAAFDNGDFIVVWESYMQDGHGYGVYGQRYTLDCQPIGTEFQINTITKGNQGDLPIVDTDAQGNFVVTWASGMEINTSDIYARYYDSSGQPVGEEFRVNTYLPNAQVRPHVAMNDNGDFVIVWQSDEQDGSERGVYGQRYASDCTPVGEEFQINTFTFEAQQGTHATMFPSGGFAVTWSSYMQDGSNWGVYAQIFDNQGNPVGEEFQVNTSTENSQAVYSICSDDEGNFLITWAHYGDHDEGYPDVFARHFTSTGIPIGDEFLISDTWKKGQSDPHASCNDAGDFAFCWDSKQAEGEENSWRDIFAKTSSAISIKPRAIVFTDETGDEDSRLEPGESGELVIRIHNIGEELEDVTAILETNDEDITISDSVGSYGTLPINTIIGNYDDPFSLALSEDAEPHLAQFTLTIHGDNSTEAFPLDIFVGRAPILLVDDDQGKPADYHFLDYETYFISTLDTLELTYEYWDLFRNEGELPTPLSDYDKIIWYTAETDTNTLTSYDVEELSNYLNNNGKLLITGQNIGADIGDISFYSDYLHAQFIQDNYEDVPIYAVQGIAGDPITDGFVSVIEGEFGADNQISPDVIEPVEGAYKIFNYSMSEEYGAGVRWEGDNKVVYLSFSFEAILNDYQREDLMERILDWLHEDTDVTSGENISVPKNFALHQNYPNPFNPNTTIQFNLPDKSDVNLSVYDITGKLVKTLVNGKKEKGYHSIIWHGRDDDGTRVPSGIYVYRLETTDGYEETKRMILLK